MALFAADDRTRRRTVRTATGISGGQGDDPPRQALDALATHYAAKTRPVRGEAEVWRIAPILTAWLEGPAANTARASAYGYAVL